jgi:hypothetical protein
MALIPLNFGLGGGGGSDEVTATKAQVLTGYTAITADSADEPIEGTIPIKSGQTYYPTLANQSIAQGQYLGGIQVINKITPSNITAENIKAGTTVKVNNGNADIIDVEGTYSTPSSGQNPIVSSKVLTGYSGFVNGGAEVKGDIPLKQAQTYNVSSSDQSVTAGQYLNGTQTFRGVTTSNIDAGNIRKGVVAKVGDAGDNGRIKNVTGTYSTPSSGQSPVIAGAMLSGYSGFVNGGGEVKGNIPSKAAATYNVSGSDQTVAAGQYLSGAQTFRGVTTSNIDAGNIKKGVNVKVGDSANTGRIKNITGTYTTPSSGQSPVVAGAMLQGYSGFVNGGGEVKGTIVNRGQFQYGNMAEAGDYYAFNGLPEGAYFSNGASWAPEARCSKDNVRNYLGVSADKIVSGQSIAGINGTAPVPRDVYVNVTSSSSRQTFYTNQGVSTNHYYIEIDGSAFINCNPKCITVQADNNWDFGFFDGYTWAKIQFDPNVCNWYNINDSSGVIITRNKILVPVGIRNLNYGVRIVGF